MNVLIVVLSEGVDVLVLVVVVVHAVIVVGGVNAVVVVLILIVLGEIVEEVNAVAAVLVPVACEGIHVEGLIFEILLMAVRLASPRSRPLRKPARIAVCRPYYRQQ